MWSGERLGDPAPDAQRCAEYGKIDNGVWTKAYKRDDNYQKDNRSYLFIQVPPGFVPTTDTVVKGRLAFFGLAPVSTCPEKHVITPSVLRRQWALHTVGICLVLGATAGIALAVVEWRWRRKEKEGESIASETAAPD